MIVRDADHGPKSCRQPPNKCELKNEAENALYDFAHRKESKPGQKQRDEIAHRSLSPSERLRSRTMYQKHLLARPCAQPAQRSHNPANVKMDFSIKARWRRMGGYVICPFIPRFQQFLGCFHSRSS